MYQPRSEVEALDIYRKLILIRQCQEAIIREYPSDEIKTPVHLSIGLEGISVGVTHLLPKGSKVLDYYRNHGTYLALTGETDAYFAELYGRTTGISGGKAGSMYLASPEYGMLSGSGIVASTIPLAVGAAFAAKYRGEDTVTVALFGDGAVEEGDFWESLNLACLHRLRILFVCEDNGLAAQTFADERRGFKGSIGDVIEGFDCHTLQGPKSLTNGADVLNVLSGVESLLRFMAKDPKPALAHFKWLRFNEHVGPNTDWDKGYRIMPSLEEMDVCDPVRQYIAWLHKAYGPSMMIKTAHIAREVAEQIAASIAKAKAAPHPGAAELHQGVFA
mgnify:CR=1 FL=1